MRVYFDDESGEFKRLGSSNSRKPNKWGKYSKVYQYFKNARGVISRSEWFRSPKAFLDAYDRRAMIILLDESTVRLERDDGYSICNLREEAFHSLEGIGEIRWAVKASLLMFIEAASRRKTGSVYVNLNPKIRSYNEIREICRSERRNDAYSLVDLSRLLQHIDKDIYEALTSCSEVFTVIDSVYYEHRPTIAVREDLSSIRIDIESVAVFKSAQERVFNNAIRFCEVLQNFFDKQQAVNGK